MSTPGVWRRRLLTLLVLASYVVLAATLHHVRGAVDSGFGSFDDEPAHLVTGLMVHDYLAQGCPGSPLEFAQGFYLHYPKVAIGQWPPVFYGLQGVWMLCFGESGLSLILLMSLLTALVATIIYGLLAEDLGFPAAWILGLLFVLMPLVQRYGGMIMAEVPVALFCLLAAHQFARFLDRGWLRDCLGFSLFAILGILTKGNALALAFLVPVAIALSGRWSVLKRPRLWLAGLLVALVCGPWFWLTLSISTGTWAGGSTPSIGYFLVALRHYMVSLYGLGGLAVTLLVCVGLAVRPREQERRCLWAAITALVPSILLMHLVIPSSIDERHLIVLAPAWILLAGWGLKSALARIAHHATAQTPRLPASAASSSVGLLNDLFKVASAALGRFPGIHRHSRRFRSRRGERGGLTWRPLPVPLVRLAPLGLLLAFGVERFEIPIKSNHGYRAAVATVVDDPSLDGSAVLIASDAIGEGLFVVAMATGEERPGHTVLRGSKVLARSSWNGDNYESRFNSPEQVMGFLRETPVGVVALDLSTRKRQWFEHHDILQRLLGERVDTWEPMGVYDVERDGVVFVDALRLYRQTGQANLTRHALTIADVLGRNVGTGEPRP